MPHVTLAHAPPGLGRWFVGASAVAVGDLAGAFVLGDFGQGRVVPTAAGAVCGAFLAGVRT